MKFSHRALARTRRGDLALQLAVATTFAERLSGLMFRQPLRVDPEVTQGLLLPECRAVQGCFLRASVDLAFVCDRGRVVQTARLNPFGIALGQAGMHGAPRHVLELPAGCVARMGLLEGDWILPLAPSGTVARSVQRWCTT